MVTTAITKRAFDIYGTVDGDTCVFSRAVANRAMRDYLGFKEFHIFGEGDRYTAFPNCEFVGGMVVGVFSSGIAHAVSDRQNWFTYDPMTGAIETGLFVLNSDQGNPNTDWIETFMTEGIPVTLKIWTLVKDGTGVTVSVQSSQTENGVIYSFWSPVKIGPDDNYYRMGYATGRAGIFRSLTGRSPWTFIADAFPISDGRLYTEADFCWRADDTILAVCRDNTGGSSAGNLYWATADGDGSNWSGATLFTPALINGVQPRLVILQNDDILLMTSDRTGPSGMSAEVALFGVDTTGVTAWRLPDGSAPDVGSWTSRQFLSQFYSTDGAQPWPVLLGTGEVLAPFYARRSYGLDPVVFALRFNPMQL